MKITFLGTGSSLGIPIIGCDCSVCNSDDIRNIRSRSSLLISTSKTNYVIDCGPDFRLQMIKAKVSDVRAVLFTHEHADHTSGIDDVRPFCFGKKTIPFYALDRVFKSIESRFKYVFDGQYPGAPKISFHRINHHSPFVINDDITVIPIQIMHGTLPILGYRIGNVAYLTDTKEIPPSELKKLENLEVLIIGTLRKEPHPSHCSIEESIAYAKQIRAEKTYFTHIDHRLGEYSQVSEQLEENIYLAYDGLSIAL